VAVPAYWLFIVLLTVAAGPVFGAFVAVNKANENARRAIAEQRRTDEAAKAEADRAEAAAKAEARRLSCAFFALNLDVFEETPPVSATGRNLRANLLDFYQLSECQPPRK
jgi:regulator of protease activity HflC (stomatin/prohibitin superfamily)